MEEKRRGSKDRKRDRPSSSPLSPPTPKIQRKQEVGAEQQGSPSHPCVNYVECPQKFEDDGKKISIFMAGGISGCSDWQTDLKEKLHSRISRLVLINPRRHNFNSKDESLTRGQITWEFQHLRLASAILFWFPKETLCPITLYELGCWNMVSDAFFAVLVCVLPRGKHLFPMVVINLGRGEEIVHWMPSRIPTSNRCDNSNGIGSRGWIEGGFFHR